MAEPSLASAVFATGPHYATLGGNNLGLTQGPIEIIHQPLGEKITSDWYGDAAIDYIDRGVDCFARMTLKEWNAYVRGAIYNTGTTMGTPGLLGVAGRLYTDLAAALVITPAGSTPAATAGNTTFTASLAIHVPGPEISIPLGSVVRDIPITFALLPYNDSGTIRHYALS